MLYCLSLTVYNSKCLLQSRLHAVSMICFMWIPSFYVLTQSVTNIMKERWIVGFRKCFILMFGKDRFIIFTLQYYGAGLHVDFIKHETITLKLIWTCCYRGLPSKSWHGPPRLVRRACIKYYLKKKAHIVVDVDSFYRWDGEHRLKCYLALHLAFKRWNAVRLYFWIWYLAHADDLFCLCTVCGV